MLFPGNVISLLCHRRDDVLYLKHSITRSQQMSQSYPWLLGWNATCTQLLVILNERLTAPQTRSITEPTDCSVLSSLSCVSHSQVAEVIVFLCWLLRCHGCLQNRHAWVRGRDCTPNSGLKQWFPSPHTPFRSLLQTEASLFLPTRGSWDASGCSDFRRVPWQEPSALVPFPWAWRCGHTRASLLLRALCVLLTCSYNYLMQ